MKVGVLGDIHSNLSALEAVLGALDRQGAEHLVSVGDVVGYGAAPAACISLLIERGASVVQGNHDAAVAGQLDDCFFNPHARAAVAWTKAALKRDELSWLAALPPSLLLDSCEVAHGTIAEPERFHYLMGPADGVSSLDTLQRPVGLVGHTHVPLAVLRLADAPDQVAYTEDLELDLTGVERAVLNVGSVGQPRDRDPRAAYLLLDTTRNSAVLHRVEYDVEAESRRILDAGLPAILAERLAMGV